MNIIFVGADYIVKTGELLFYLINDKSVHGIMKTTIKSLIQGAPTPKT